MLRPGLISFRAAARPIRSHVPSRPYRQQRFGDNSPRSSRQFLGGFFLRWASRPTFYRDIAVISGGAGAAYLFNLEEVPISGRRRFNIVSPAIEAWVGKTSVDAVREQYQGRFLPETDPRVRLVQKVLDRLVPYAHRAGLHDVDWEVNVIDSSEVNAFVAPGGKVFVFTGILPMCRDEDGIAAVLGHEIAHVVAHHSAYAFLHTPSHSPQNKTPMSTNTKYSEQLSRSPIVGLGALALMSIDLSLATSMMLVNLFLSWPGSRKQEAEADYIGLLMMAESCYRPEAAMELWNRMERAAGGNSPPQILSTHPSNHNREETIREWIPKAREQAEKAECGITAGYANQFAATFGQFQQFPRW
ncbi:unnamed protein product [Periconia digitata]|uniref:Peptidase M48 domain-containing protein n=1 Tax=Periconia digitata TaxID=1303443 RepID=A0A9W4UHF2_9PLEO|nr:unnamed protein product [Periconia digitata]